MVEIWWCHFGLDQCLHQSRGAALGCVLLNFEYRLFGCAALDRNPQDVFEHKLNLIVLLVQKLCKKKSWVCDRLHVKIIVTPTDLDLGVPRHFGKCL